MKTDKLINGLEYKPNPTIEDLVDFFMPIIRVRQAVPRELMRLQGVPDYDIDKMESAVDEKGKRIICKTAEMKLAGNSIPTTVLKHIFRTLWIPNQPEHDSPDKNTGTIIRRRPLTQSILF